jgi:hypothetical protein
MAASPVPRSVPDPHSIADVPETLQQLHLPQQNRARIKYDYNFMQIVFSISAHIGKMPSIFKRGKATGSGKVNVLKS